MSLDQIDVLHLQPLEAVMDTLCDCCCAEIKLGFVISAHFGGQNDLVPWQTLQSMAQHLQQGQLSVSSTTLPLNLSRTNAKVQSSKQEGACQKGWGNLAMPCTKLQVAVSLCMHTVSERVTP